MGALKMAIPFDSFPSPSGYDKQTQSVYYTH